MNLGRWLDHLPPWLAWGALVATGVYSPGELGLMAGPLLLALLAEARTWSLGRHRHWVELAALAGFLVQVVARTGLVPTVVTTLFMLCAARLCLPRELPQRRQILLMGFLIQLTTAISTAELDFLLWSVLWVAGAATVLMQQNWERSARLRPGPMQAPPYALVLRWSALSMLLASGFFVILPRLRLGFRALPVGVHSLSGIQVGLSDVLDLTGSGRIQDNHEVVLRVLPGPEASAAQFAALKEAAGLLRGFALETLQGQRWELSPHTPAALRAHWNSPAAGIRPVTAEFFLGPTLLGTVPLPYGDLDLETAPGENLRFGEGGSIRWQYPIRRTTSLRLNLTPSAVLREPPPSGARLARLTDPGRDTGSALRWSLRKAPGDLAPRVLAQRLSQALREFRYTLDNPSGQAANPLTDFLEHSQAGHCEYFASALAIMLRQRGVPSRVITGYHLGPWIAEGGYFLVTQAEAHSWVEYYDAAVGAWRVADPTPPGSQPGLGDGTLLATLGRWTDALRFRWDRHVVRFSDQDQVDGIEWLHDRAQALARWKPSLPAPRTLAGIALILLLAWRLRRWRPRFRPGPGAAPAPGRIRELAPLLRRTRATLPPLPGETAQAWLERLALARPARAEALRALAQEANAVAYGGKPPRELKALVKSEGRAWRAAGPAPPGTAR